MGQLSLEFLGTPKVQHAGSLITFPTRKASALLVYLAVEGGVHSREKITTLFWPESSSGPGRATLRSTLRHLRESLGETGPAHTPPHLVTDRDTLRFDASFDLDFDLDTLESAVHVTHELPLLSSSASSPNAQSANIHQLIAQLKAATSCYRGDFLEGFSLGDTPAFDDWVMLQSEIWHRKAMLVFDWLSLLQSEGGEVGSALETTIRWVAFDPFNEAAHRRLIQLHFAAGDRAAALRAYRDCQAILAEELNAEPAPETTALAERIRSESPPPDRGATAAREAALPHLTAEPPLVGRMVQHLELVTAYRLARRGRPQAVTIEGEPGIGKTRLAKEFLAWASAQGADIWHGRAYEMSGLLPYQPVIEVLRQRLRRVTNLPQVLSDTWLAELSRLLPELSDRIPDLPAPLKLNEVEARTRLFEAVARFGQALADRVPVVILLDDLQWADAASLDVLHYLAGRWGDEGVSVLLLFAARAEDLSKPIANAPPDAPILSNWLTSLGNNLPLTRLSLNPLTLADTQQLVWSMGVGDPGSGAAPSLSHELEAFCQRLFSETRGHPFFIIETLRSLSDRGLLQRHESGGWTADWETALRQWKTTPDFVPARIQDLIRARLAQLSPQAQLACTASAVLGQGFDFAQLCQVADLEERDTLPALEALLNRGLLHETNEGYVFVHETIREVAYTDISQTRRRILHQRALATLESVAAPPASLARHALAAGLTEPAFRYSLAAGDGAMHLFAMGDAIAHYEAARQILTGGQLPSSIEAADWRYLYTHLGRALELNSQFDEALRIYDELRTVAREQANRQLELAALIAQATAYAITSPVFDLEQGKRLSEQALTLARELGNQAAEAKILWNLMLVHRYGEGDPHQVVAYGEKSLAIARELNLPEQIGLALNDLGQAYGSIGQLDRAQKTLAEAREVWRKRDNLPLLADNLRSLSTVNYLTGNYQQALTEAEEASRISQSIGNVWGHAGGLHSSCYVYLESGKPGQAIEALKEAIHLGERGGLSVFLPFGRSALGWVYSTLGAFEPGVALCRQARVEVVDVPPALRPWVLAMIALAEILNGNLADAEATIRESEIGLRMENLTYSGSVFVFLSKVQLGLARSDTLRDIAHLDNQVAFLEHAGVRTFLPDALYLKSKALLAQGRAEEAREGLAQARAKAEAIGSQRSLWPILFAFSQLEAQHGQPVAAQKLREQAQEVIEFITDHAGTPELRASFLNLPEVQAVLSV
ncbi:MAG: hypothetical protein DPW09_10085 [Anaerolineae bacterium]|nr:hypothetical protein [Anaerolineae bacterium]